MHLSWNEIRAHAARFAEEWKEAEYEKGETQTFYNEFFEVFGVSRRRVAAYEQPVKLLGNRRGFRSEEWKEAEYEKGETQTFYNEFFEVFGVSRRRVAAYEQPVKLLGNRRGF